MAAERQPRRILMTADTVGGVWQFAMTLCRELALAGDRVLLATLGPLPSPDQRAQAATIPGLVLAERASRLVWMDEPWQDMAAAGDWLLQLASRFRPDLVHLNDFGHGHLAWPAPVLLTDHSCVASWWQAVHGCEPPAEWDRYRDRVRAAVAAASLVVAPTQAMLRALDQHYGPLPRARVIANGREPSALAGSGDDQLVLAAGRVWDEAKNLSALAAVAPSLPWPVCIAGDGRHPAAVAGGPVSHDGELPNVQLLGRLSPQQLAGWFARAPVYALPARYEPFGLSVLEAALAGCALVLGDVASLREVWCDAALYVAPDDHHSLRRALLALIGDPVLRARMATRARLRAARYTPRAMANGYRDAYDALLQPGGHGSGAAMPVRTRVDEPFPGWRAACQPLAAEAASIGESRGAA